MSKKKQYLAAVILILAGLLLLGKGIWDHRAAKEASPDTPPAVSEPAQSEDQSDSEESETPAASAEAAKERVLKELLYDNTYEYIDEFRSGHPVTYTFYADGKLLVYYWESDEMEDVPIGSASAIYTISREIDEITITWADNGSTEVKPFKLTKNHIVLGDSELNKVHKSIYENGKELS